MPGSTYSTNLKVELMATGENSGTWGDITNTNLGTALEQAIVGYGNPNYSSDANLTISITNSNAAQAARALVLNVTSSVSLTATRELVVPTIQKQYIVQNNTTGSQSITVKTSAGTGITVPNGRKAHLYVDGTNVIQMFDFVDINGGAIDGTPIGASSASTGAFTTLNASGATTLDGNVTLGNASGDNVTVTGTITSNLLFTDNTYDIGASGATRPRNLFLAGAATIGGNLSVGGTLTLTGGVNLNGNVTVGDNSSDTLTINSTITSNLLFTDNTYDIGASGATRPRNLFLAGNATVGGNQTLTGSLTVDSTTDSSSTTTGSIQTDGGLGVAKALYVGTTANVAGASNFATSTGSVGVGTASPNGKLQVAGTFASQNNIVSITSSGVATAATGAVRALYVNAQTANTASTVYGVFSEVTYTNSQTNYGGYFSAGDPTGTSYGVYGLAAQTDVNGPGTAYGGYFKATAALTGSSGITYGARIENAGAVGNSAYGLTVSTVAGASTVVPFQVIHAGSEALRVDSSRNLLIGLTSALTNGKLQIAGGIGLSGNTQIRQATNADGNTLQLFATQVVVGPTNSLSYGYTGGGLLASVSNAAAAITLDVGGNVAGHRLKVVNDSGGSQGYLEYSDAGASRFYVNSSTGRTGIGTNSPVATLHAQGSSGAVPIGYFLNTNSSYSNDVYVLTVDSGNHTSNVTVAGAMRVAVNGNSYAQVINGLGNVYFGQQTGQFTANGEMAMFSRNQNSPTYLTLNNQNAGASASAGLVLGANGNSWVMRTSSTASAYPNALAWYLDTTSPNLVMFLDNAGKLCIGSSANNAGAKLFVNNSINTDWAGTIALRYNVAGQSNAYYKGMTGLSIENGQARGLHIFNYDQDSNNGINFYPNSYQGQTANPAVKILSTGQMLVGTTSTFGGAGQFAIDQSGGGIPAIHLIGTQGVGGGGRETGATFSVVTNDTGPAYGNVAKIGAAKENATQGNTAGYLAFYTTPNGGSLTNRMQITSSGNVFINDTAAQYSARLYVNGSIAARNGGVDGTFQDALVAGYTSNYSETNVIQSSVSSNAGASGFRFQVSNGGGSSGLTTAMDVLRSVINFYSGGSIVANIQSGGFFLSGANYIYWDKSGTRSWQMFCNQTSSNLIIQSGDSLGTINLVSSTVAVSGSLSKGSGSFRIEHPLPELAPTHQLVHSFIEGPQADLIYRGKANLVNGTATINVDQAAGMTEGTFVALCRDVQCFTTNESDWTAVRGSVSGNILTIEAQDNTSTASISWMVIGERQDRHMYETEWTDDNGKVIVEPLKPQ